MKRLIMIGLLAVLQAQAMAATDSLKIVRMNKQRHFKGEVPAGNYSGIARIGEGNRYAVVSDKSEQDGFFEFEINVDSVDGRVRNVRNLGFRSDGAKNRDTEAVAYMANTKTLMLTGEADGTVVEYDLQGRRTGRMLNAGATLKDWTVNYGLESLSYCDVLGKHVERRWSTSHECQ